MHTVSRGDMPRRQTADLRINLESVYVYEVLAHAQAQRCGLRRSDSEQWGRHNKRKRPAKFQKSHTWAALRSQPASTLSTSSAGGVLNHLTSGSPEISVQIPRRDTVAPGTVFGDCERELHHRTWR